MTLFYFFLFPLFASAVLFFLGSRKLKGVAFLLSVVPLAIQVTSGASLFAMSYETTWLEPLSIRFSLAVDHLSGLFLYIANVIVPIAILSSSSQGVQRPNFFYGLILLLQALLIGFFASRDLVCFTFFFEAMLLPLYFLISGWGGKSKENASFTFILYMVSGSILMVAAVLALYASSISMIGQGTFDMNIVATFAEKLPFAPLLSAIFLLAFLVKTPIFPFHAWLPDAYCQAPLPGTILLSAVLSKAGIYGIVRVSMAFFPTIFAEWSSLLLVFATVGMLYGAFAAWGQTDFKRLIAYSSLSHVNFVLAGLFVSNQMAQSGAILQAVNHSITITGLFLVVAWLEERLGSTQFGTVSGLASYMPNLAWLTFFFVLSAVALPGLNNFVSEVMVLYGAFLMSPFLSALLGTTVILSIIYMLRFMHRVYFETVAPFQAGWVDIGRKEQMIALPLVLLVLWLGIYPGPVLKQLVS
jgi:NADH-quinone oxidoreductase subunit M